MIYSKLFNLFLRDETSISSTDKVKLLGAYTVKNLLTLLRNIEESPKDYDEEVINGVYKYHYENKIICV
jgi:hypothetical protein